MSSFPVTREAAFAALNKLHLEYLDFVQHVQQSETMTSLVTVLHEQLEYAGVPKPYPDAEQLLLSISVFLFTLAFYFVFFGNRHRNRRKRLRKELDRAQDLVQKLQDQISYLEETEAVKVNKSGKEIRVWMDGAFDIMHYGHMNAFRQGRALGTCLVVGVNSDESITRCKGTAPVMNDAERMGAVKGCKWVDEVVFDVPYVMNREYLDMVIQKYRIDLVVHGDDPCIVDGKDVYEDAKNRGIYRSIPRTEGVSTTDIVGRMLYLTKDHHEHKGANSSLVSSRSKNKDSSNAAEKFFSRRSKFLTTSRMLRIFSAGHKAPKKGAKIVYVDGAFDMFHVGHVQLLKKARELGDYLIVGVYNDDTVNQHRGLNYPIMNLNERVLSVLACTHVDDLLIDAPWDISREMISSLNISIVACGTTSDSGFTLTDASKLQYRIPHEMGILHQLKSESSLTVPDIVKRIVNNEKVFQNKVDKKMEAENEYYSNRYGFDADGNPVSNGTAE